MDRKYNLRLDLQFRCNNSKMIFNEFDNDTSDFFMRITRGGELFNIDKAIVALCVIKPDGSSDAEFINIKEGKVYANLPNNLKDIPGTYKAKALLVLNNEKVVVGPIEYEVDQDNIISKVNREVQDDNRFTILTDMISRLSTVENAEELRKQAEINRGQAEKLREEAIEKIKSDTTKLITDTKKEISDYKNAKDTAIDNDLKQFKEATNQAIEEYKSNKDTEINNNLKEYKSSTTDDIEEFKNTKSRELDDFKNTKNSEIDNYKKEKDLAINQYVKNKNLELDEYVAAKNRELDEYKGAKDKEIDQYKNTKDKLINDKISEVEAAKQNIVSTANNKVSEMNQAKTNMQNSVNSKLEEADNRISELQNFETQLDQIENKNTEQDTRLKQVEYKNKVQDVYVQGLFNENKDKRLTIEGEGNSLKLEGSKTGLVEVNKVDGDTLVNLAGIGGNKVNGCKITEDNVITFSGTSIVPNILFYLGRSLVANKVVTGKLQVRVPTGATSIYLLVRDITNNLSFYIEKRTITNETYIEICGTTTITTDTSEDVALQVVFNFETAEENAGIQTEISDLLLLEGDYTNKPIPSEYFEGMQSTFENCQVTQEMIDSGEESVENLGKYKVGVKVIGRNKFNINDLKNNIIYSNSCSATINGNNLILKPKTTGTHRYVSFRMKNLKKNTRYVVTFKHSLGYSGFPIRVYNNNDDRYVAGLNSGSSFTTPNGEVRFLFYTRVLEETTVNEQAIFSNIQIEEGTQATPYEPYFERTQTVYLNSPLLKGDEIVCKEDGLYHWHKMGKGFVDSLTHIQEVRTNTCTVHADISEYKIKTFTSKLYGDIFFYHSSSDDFVHFRSDGSSPYSQLKIYTPISWGTTKSEISQKLKENPLTFVGELAEPYYEKISDDKLILEIPNNATLSVESVIPCQSISASYTGNIPSVYALEETNANQDNLIDISLMATDEMYMMLEPILEAMPQTIKNERMVSKMVDMYVAMVIRGLKTIDEVPARYRKEVQSILDKLEK